VILTLSQRVSEPSAGWEGCEESVDDERSGLGFLDTGEVDGEDSAETNKRKETKNETTNVSGR